MQNNQNNKPVYDLENRTQVFAQNIRSFVQKLPRTISHIEDAKQLIRSSGSVGANYIEANESLSRKDFVMRIKICRKEAKESKYWLCLITTDNNTNVESERQHLYNEASELTKIFGAILEKSK